MARLRPTLPSLLPLALAAAFVAPVSAGELIPEPSTDSLPNPHRGFMLWGTGGDAADPATNRYNSYLYHVYVPWRLVEPRDNQFDWDGFERLMLKPLRDADPKATFVLRLVADYPGGPDLAFDYPDDGDPAEAESGARRVRDFPYFLIAPESPEKPGKPIPSFRYGPSGDSTAVCTVDEDGFGDGGLALDYDDPRAQTQMQELIEAFAKRYGNRADITAIQTGLIGFWGERHSWPCENTLPPQKVTTREFVRDAFKKAFKNALVPLQTRYARPSDVDGTGFGFYEDAFPTMTTDCNRFPWFHTDDTPLPAGRTYCWSGSEANLEFGMKALPAARKNWKANPVSGESVGVNGLAWVHDNSHRDVLGLVREYHLSWLGPAGVHTDEAVWNNATQRAHMLDLHRALGYELTVRRVQWPDRITAGRRFSVTLKLQNTGVAPLYHVYYPRLDWVDGQGITRASAVATDWPLNSLQPGPEAGSTEYILALTAPASLAPGRYRLHLTLADAAAGRPNIHPQNHGRDAEGRLPLGDVQVVARKR